MFRVFRNIPKHIRQQAFDLIVQSGYFTSYLHSPYEAYAGKINNRHVCPLGAVNYLFQDKLPEKIFFSEPRDERFNRGVMLSANILMPGGGWVEQRLLAGVGITVDKVDADKFMVANDRGRFNTPAKLATAMGAKYEPLEDA